MIAVQSLTEGSADDAVERIKLLQSVGCKVRSFTADGAYDSSAISAVWMVNACFGVSLVLDGLAARS